MKEAYQLISDIFTNTNTEIVPEKRGDYRWNPFTFLRWYGTLKVEGEDNIPEQEQE
jgi:hypothetical protein